MASTTPKPLGMATSVPATRDFGDPRELICSESSSKAQLTFEPERAAHACSSRSLDHACGPNQGARALPTTRPITKAIATPTSSLTQPRCTIAMSHVASPKVIARIGDMSGESNIDATTVTDESWIKPAAAIAAAAVVNAR